MYSVDKLSNGILINKTYLSAKLFIRMWTFLKATDSPVPISSSSMSSLDLIV